MPTRTTVLPSFYQDSVMLMRIAGQVRSRPGVRQTAAFMGTPANHALLEETGLATPESRNARAEDLILTVDADTDAEAEAALAEARQLLVARRHAVETATALRPRTLDSALKILPNANLVVISVPGAYAKFEAMRALKRGLHVFLFSDNVPVQDEIDLKREAVKRRLVCMGPDCGTAYLNGTGIGFYNVVPRGRIGIVAASGTGLQAVASRLAAQGEGVSHGIGVGGRDLSAEVGGAMSSLRARVVGGRPDHRGHHPDLQTAASHRSPAAGSQRWRALESRWSRACWAPTHLPAVRRSGSRRSTPPRMPWSHAWRTVAWTPAAFGDPASVRARLQALRSSRPAIGPGVLGLYTGGTLAHEAHLLLKRPARGFRAPSRPGPGRRPLHRRSAPPHDRSGDSLGPDREGRRLPRDRRASGRSGARARRTSESGISVGGGRPRGASAGPAPPEGAWWRWARSSERPMIPKGLPPSAHNSRRPASRSSPPTPRRRALRRC